MNAHIGLMQREVASSGTEVVDNTQTLGEDMYICGSKQTMVDSAMIKKWEVGKD